MNEKVILTLTTIPERLTYDHPLGLKSVVYSLMSFTYNNYEVHFNIPYTSSKGDEYIIPEWLKELNGRNGLRIFRIDEDYGSITKLLPTVQRIKDDNQLIIVVDDDLIYESRMIEEHLKLREENDDVVWGFAGLGNMDDKLGDPRDRFVIGVNKHTKVSMIEHYKTVSYRRRFFEDDFNVDFTKRGWADDHLVSAYMGMKGINKIVAYTNYINKHNDIDEWRKYGIVESFPVIRHSVTQNRQEGCNLQRAEKKPPIDKDLEKYLI